MPKNQQTSNYSVIYHIEMDRVLNRQLLSVSRVTSIIDFSETLIKLKMRRGSLHISGEKLEINVYENRLVDITGKVDKIEFL